MLSSITVMECFWLVTTALARVSHVALDGTVGGFADGMVDGVVDEVAGFVGFVATFLPVDSGARSAAWDVAFEDMEDLEALQAWLEASEPDTASMDLFGGADLGLVAAWSLFFT